MTCLLQDWVMNLPLREQGKLMTSMRCCDVAPKQPICIDERYGCSTGESSAERHLHAFLRFCCINAADSREIVIPGAWFQSEPPKDWKPSQFGHYPLHWYSHLMHCFEVVGYRHPNVRLRHMAYGIYLRMVSALHLNVETFEEMVERLAEDRIENGTVVS